MDLMEDVRERRVKTSELVPKNWKNGVTLSQDGWEGAGTRNSALDMVGLRCLLDTWMEMSSKQVDMSLQFRKQGLGFR